MALVTKRLLDYDGLAAILVDLSVLTVQEIAATAYTLTNADLGKLLVFTAATDVTLTLPQVTTHDAYDGFFCMGVQDGAGQVILAVEGADVLRTYPAGSDRSAGQYAQFSVIKRTDGFWYAGGEIV